MIINNYFTIASIIALIWSGLVIYISYKEGEKISDCIGCGIVMVVISGCVLLLVGGLIDCFTEYRTETQYTTQSDLVALNDFTGQESNVSGSFFLCVGGLSGSSSDTYNIRYASKTNEVIKINTIEVDNNKVGFVEDGNAKIIIYHKKYVYERNKLGEWLFGKDTDSFDLGIIGYEFHVPKGSITNEVKVDLK